MIAVVNPRLIEQRRTRKQLALALDERHPTALGRELERQPATVEAAANHHNRCHSERAKRDEEAACFVAVVSARRAISSPMARDAVAAGLGAFSTCSACGASWNWKSSTSVPSARMACA